MTDAEHQPIWKLLDAHANIKRNIEEIPGGVKTTTTTSRPELVDTLRTHVRQMVKRMEEARPVRLWDKVFSDMFAHASEIQVKVEDIDGGIVVTETSNNLEVVPLIRTHSGAVSRFVAEGHPAVRPPWAGGGRRVAAANAE